MERKNHLIGILIHLPGKTGELQPVRPNGWIIAGKIPRNAKRLSSSCRRVIAKRGHIGADDLASVRAAAYSTANIIDVVALVAQFSMTNFIRNVAGTPIDFDVVKPSGVRG